MANITQHDAQIVVYGEVATVLGSAVEAVITPLTTAVEGAIVTLGNTTSTVALKVAVSGKTVTITPASTVIGNDVYRIVAWGF